MSSRASMSASLPLTLIAGGGGAKSAVATIDILYDGSVLTRRSLYEEVCWEDLLRWSWNDVILCRCL